MIEIENYGFYYQRGPFFWTIALLSSSAMGIAVINLSYALKKSTNEEKTKYYLALIGYAGYLVIGIITVYGYLRLPLNIIISWTPFLIILPFIPLFVSILCYGLISSTDSIFNIKEFFYLTIGIGIVILIYSSIIYLFGRHYDINVSYLIAIIAFLVIFTHGLYDWLITFLRDFIYHTKSNLSFITDNDLNDLLKNFHNSERLETNRILKFRVIKTLAKESNLIDTARDFVKQNINSFKQDDYPRRTKANLKYQILKMIALDEADEGQILWECGFEGYPFKIISGEDKTRKPLFKTEAMSDYTATSRNAFIALKKEAIRDLAWRLSYLEKTLTTSKVDSVFSKSKLLDKVIVACHACLYQSRKGTF